MLFTAKPIAPERVSRWAVWVFVVLVGGAGLASIGFPGGVPAPDTTLPGPGAVETTLAHGVTMLAGLVEAAWRETVREVSRVVIAVLEFHWWPLDLANQANGVNWQDLSSVGRRECSSLLTW
jgi:hypothetical protein